MRGWHCGPGLLLALVCGTALAQQPYPNRTIRLIVPSLPGGGTDISARVIAPKLSEQLGQQVVVENRAGASMMIGGEAVARAAPDGYTLLMGISTLTINPYIQKKVPYDTIKDFAPISQVVWLPNVLVAHPQLPARNVKEVIALAKTRPGQLTYGSAGVGTNLHLSMELFLAMSGVKITHVPYKGASGAIVDVMAGQITMLMSNILTALPHIKANKIRPYGVTSARRATGAPDIPTIAEAGVPGYEAVQWYGVLAPANTPREVITKLHSAIAKTVQDPTVRERFLVDGAEPVGNTPEEFAAVIRSELQKWGKVIKAAGIQPE